MNKRREDIINCLNDFTSDNEKLISELNNLTSKHGLNTYSTILHILTHIDLEPDKAKESWEKILLHRIDLSTSLKREVNLRTAICDYFCSIDVSLKNPKVIEISIFESKDKASMYDSLTGLFNRLHFDQSYDKEVARAKRYKLELSILFFDLDNFKTINDTYGHLVGDDILRSVSSIVKAEIRAEDIGCRYGGEEIVVILPQTNKIRAYILAERIREKVETIKHESSVKTKNVTISGGLATFPTDTDDETDLLQYADSALYEAKSNQKNCIATYQKHKRKYFRIDFNTKIQVQPVENGDETEIIKVNSRNFSKAGLLFESNRPFKINDLISITIPLNNNEENVIVKGNVIRVEIYSDNVFDIGVSFLNVDNSIKDDITKYMMKSFEKIYL